MTENANARWLAGQNRARTKKMHCTRVNLVLKYRDQGLSILPANGKRPAVKRFQQYIDGKTVANEQQLVEWFDRTDFNIAIVCGAPSGGLVVADFDNPVGYGNWAQQHPDLAASAPTAETGRGFHVYTHGEFNGIKKMPCGGEVRGKGIVIAPDSKHPSGRLYRWLNPLGEIPVVDPSIFLASSSLTSQPAQTTRLTQITHGMRVTSVEAAVQATLPNAFGQRSGCLFQLARHLKAIIPDATPAELRLVVPEWHKMALPKIKTKGFDESWQDFIRSWGRVKRPTGQPSWKEVVAIAEMVPLPASGLIYDSEPYHRLVKLVLAQHQAFGGAAFPLSCRVAADHCGVCEKTGANMLKTLVFDGLLAIHKKYPGKRLAHEYRFTGIGGAR